jgi:hypothetical protein
MAISMLATQITGGAASQTAVDYGIGTTPWVAGRKVAAHINSGPTAAGTAPSYIIEGSNTAADSGFTTLLESVLFGHKTATVTLYRWMRFRIATAAGTAGVGISAWLDAPDL